MSSPPPLETVNGEEEKEETVDDKMKIPQPMCKRRRLDVQNVDQSKMVDIQSLPANPLLEATFQKQPAVMIKAFGGNKVYVVNTGDADVSIPVGAVLCGYGKGRFDRDTRGTFTPDRHSMLEIKTCDDLVVYRGVMMTVKEVIRAQRIT